MSDLQTFLHFISISKLKNLFDEEVLFGSLSPVTLQVHQNIEIFTKVIYLMTLSQFQWMDGLTCCLSNRQTEPHMG